MNRAGLRWPRLVICYKITNNPFNLLHPPSCLSPPGPFAPPFNTVGVGDDNIISFLSNGGEGVEEDEDENGRTVIGLVGSCRTHTRTREEAEWSRIEYNL